jgi:multidrug efflux pump subunit AcrB
MKKQNPGKDLHSLYFKAFNYKIIPVILTIVSTIAGLIPFIWDGQNEVFWFSFAAGSIGGLMFSILGIMIYLPLFIIKKNI